jgi:anti-sigma regulatory factor (Ser/Thr protein kinase)
MLRFALDELAVPEARSADIELAVSEATGNVVRHAYAEAGHSYRVTIEFFTRCVCLQVEDAGRGFIRASVPPPNAEQVGGRGLWLIEHLADSTTISALPDDGCCLRAEFGLTHPLGFLAPCPPRTTDSLGEE